MPKIAVFTSARSDYGLLRGLIRELKKWSEVDLLISGAHFCQNKGNTLNEILSDRLVDLKNMIKVPAFLDAESPGSLGKAVGLAQISFSQIFEDRTWEGILFLGDRFELFGVSVPAMLAGIPLFHISGGEVTEGVIDDSVRHAHTKLANLHFVATEPYAANVSSMGEEDWRIVISGECGLDEMHGFKPASNQEILEGFGIDVAKPVVLISFHPETQAGAVSPENQVDSLLQALGHLSAEQLVFSSPGFEKGAGLVTERLMAFCRQKPNRFFAQNFGRTRYLSILRQAQVLVGNSSSGLVEAPSFGIPSVNIGERQKNRILAPSVLSAPFEPTEILKAIGDALKPEFRTMASKALNPYDPYRDGRNSERIAFAIKKALTEIPRDKLLRKRFVTSISRGEWNTLLLGFGKTA